VTDFHAHVRDYLRIRRALGFKLTFHGQVLPQFASYLQAAGASTLTVQLAVAWAGRPDMAMWLFTKAIFAGEPIRLFDYGRVRRDFTYVDDVVEAVVRLVGVPPAPDPAWSGEAPDPSTSYAPWRVHNIGNRNPIEITEVVRLLEEAIGRPAVKVLEPLQLGDVTATYADVSSLQAAVDFRPDTPIKEGIARFVAWYKDYHGLA